MKNVSKLITVLCCFALFFMLGIATGAEESASYTVAGEEGNFSLYSAVSPEAEPVFVGSTLNEVLEFILSECNLANVYFSSVKTESELLIPSGGFTFSGSIEFLGSASLVIDGGQLTLSSIELNFFEGALKIKNGSAYLLSGSICSRCSTAVIMNHSAGAYFCVSGGKIESHSQNPAITLAEGVLKISGGEIISESREAINSSSTLILTENPKISGLNFDVVTTSAITLFEGGSAYRGELSVKYNSIFNKGESTEIFRCRSQDEIENITFFDENYSPCELTYFEDENIASVYRPFTLEFYDRGNLVHSSLLLKNEIADKPNSPTRQGYDFDGWRMLSERGELYEFASGVSSDLRLYASYRLTSPSFNLSSLNFTYDGNMHFLVLEEINHPFINDGIVSCEWYKDGNSLLKFGDRIGIKNVSDSGNYKCEITFSVAGDSVTKFTPEVSVNVEKAQVEIPIIPSVYYTGDDIFPEIYDSGSYSVARYSAKNAGIYPITLTLVDSSNYSFIGSDQPTVSVDFEIKKVENYWREELSAGNIYSGESPNVNAISAFGIVKYLYSDRFDGVFKSEPPKIAGLSYVKAYVSETDNFTALESEPKRFTVLEEKVLGIAVLTSPAKNEYKAFEHFIPSGMTVGVSYNSGRQEIVSSDSLVFSYQRAESFRFGDSGVIVSYGGVSVVYRVNVSKAVYDISGLSFLNTEEIYSGGRKSISYIGNLPVGLDGISLMATVTGGGVNSGVYVCTMTFETKSENYITPEPLEAELRILPCEKNVIWGERVFTYDSTPKVPSAYFVDVFGRNIPLSVRGARTYAGVYTATVEYSDPNYILLGCEESFTVAKANYDMSEIVWSSDSFVYDGEEKRVEIIHGLPNGVSVIGYANNKGTNSGDYTATATFGYDEANYNPPVYNGYNWKINKASYNIDGFVFLDNIVVYDGKEHYPILTGEMPIGIDSHPLEYSFSRGVKDVTEGIVEVEIIFNTQSINYLIPESVKAYVEITPREIIAVWSELETVYDGTLHLPTAYALECEIAVGGAEKNAGEYYATAISLDKNYKITNSTVSYKILKAENRWIDAISVSDVYFGNAPTPKAKAEYGEVRFLFYKDAECTLPENNPSEIGLYYVKAFCDGDENHLPTESEAVSFNILEILPVGLDVDLKKSEFLAFEVILPEELVAYLLNNDGSKTMLDSALVTVTYPEFDSFRYLDSTVVFSYGEFSCEKTVSVTKNKYDLSMLEWKDASHVYDGKEKNAFLSGLPEGIEIVEYVGNGNVKAGQYLVSVNINFDDFNYFKPWIPDCKMVIERCVVPLPEIKSLVYTGDVITPELPKSELYSVSFSENAQRVGKYPVILSLFDSENYVFENGECETSVLFTIHKRALRVKIHDYKLYLFESELSPDFEIVGGELCSGDSIVPSFYSEGESIYALFSDPDYDISVIPGRLTKVYYPSLLITVLLLAALIILSILILSVVFTIRKRRALLYNYRGALYREGFDFFGRKYPFFLESPKLPLMENRAITPMGITDLVLSEGEDVPSFNSAMAIDADYADSVISNTLAKSLLRRGLDISTFGWRRKVINVDTLSKNFSAGERVDINSLKEKKLIPDDTAYIKVAAQGCIDKPLFVYANDFSLAAVKMIALTGGRAIKVGTVKLEHREKNE